MKIFRDFIKEFKAADFQDKLAAIGGFLVICFLISLVTGLIASMWIDIDPLLIIKVLITELLLIVFVWIIDRISSGGYE